MSVDWNTHNNIGLMEFLEKFQQDTDKLMPNFILCLNSRQVQDLHSYSNQDCGIGGQLNV